ncbi:MAG: hypothetical protein WCF99_18450 [Chloroflexales bacterium]
MFRIPQLRVRSNKTAAVWPLFATGIGLAGMFRAARAISELLLVLESAGAMGGTRRSPF